MQTLESLLQQLRTVDELRSVVRTMKGLASSRIHRYEAATASLDQYARSIDPEVADDAGKRIANLSGALPTKEEGFMRKVQAGQTVTAGCGIGEKVKVRYQ